MYLQMGSYACHDLPVTGLGFAPPSLAHTLGKKFLFSWMSWCLPPLINFPPLSNIYISGMKAVVTGCSADRKFAVVKVGGTEVFQVLSFSFFHIVLVNVFSLNFLCIF